MRIQPWLCYDHRHHAAAVPDAAALTVAGLVVGYPGSTKPALHLSQLTLLAGRRLALIGPNGSGKSTLLKAIAGILKPREGQVRIFGLPVNACHHRLCYLAQRGDIEWRFPISVRRLVMTGRYVHLGWLRWPRAGDHSMTEEVLDRLRIRHLANRQIGELSGGQQQRALLARALAQEADLLLLDEPLNAVDAETREVLSGVLDELQQAGKTIVIATHDHGKLDEDYDQVLFLHEGHQVRADLHCRPEHRHQDSTDAGRS